MPIPPSAAPVWPKRRKARRRHVSEEHGPERRRRRVPGLVSVIVPAYNVADNLDECLESLRNQKYDDVEIIVVDDGSPDESFAIASRHADADPRVVVLRQENAGLSAARNTGIEAADGQFLAFVDGDDRVSPVAFSSPIMALRESGSDFAVSCYDRLERDGKLVAASPWIRAAHETRRLATDLEQFPEVMVNAVAWSKVYRRAFWDRAGLSFPVGRLYEDQPVSMAAFARARAFDVLKNVGVHWRVRGDGSSISQGAASVRNLTEHNDAVNASLNALTAAGHQAAADLRAVQLLANNLPSFARQTASAGLEFWEALRTAIGMLIDRVDREDYRASVDADDKVLQALIRADRRNDVIAFLEQRGTDINRFRVVRRDGGLHAELPLTDDMPDDVTVLAERQITLEHRITQTGWNGDGGLRLTGWAYLRTIDLVDHPPSIELDLVSADGERRPFAVTTHLDPRADVAGRHAWADYRPGGFTAVLAAADLPTDEGEHVVELTMTAAEITRTTVVDMVTANGSAAVAHPRVLPEGRVIRVVHGHRKATDPTTVLHVRSSQSDAFATGLAQDGDVVIVTFWAVDPVAVHVAHVDRSEPLLTVTPARLASGQWQARVDLGGLPRGSLPDLTPAEQGRPLRFRVEHARGTAPLLAPPDLALSPGADGTRRVVTSSRSGVLEIFDWWPVATSYLLDDDRLAVTVAHALPLEGAPVLRGKGGDVPGHFETGADGRDQLVFGLTSDRWGLHDLALRSGRYTIGVVDATGHFTSLTPASELLDSLPAERLLSRYRARIELSVAVPPTFVLELAPPLSDDERGRRNQRLLMEHARVARADDDSVFFRSLYGEVADCNALAVHRELRQRQAPLRLCWSVVDRSVPVPEGGIGLVEGSREWHDVVARSRYHLVNVHQLDWHRKPEGQVIIETMHGYPYKVMGHAWWTKSRLPTHQVASFDRRARDWDYLVSPASYATPLLRAAFLDPADAQAEVLEIGYPRNDILVGPEGEKVREATRTALGIRSDQTAVLYGPTFRDYMSADDMSAKGVDFLDADRVADELGDDVVILMRGHAFTARAKDDWTGTRQGVVNVTDYPDVNDVILASDAAVLDYSSLRFDYAITDKPMIFLVPDRRRYDTSRGGILAYEPTAPGPLVTTTDEVIALLRDLPGLDRAYAADRERFRRAYVDLEDGHASARLVDAVFVPRGDAAPAQ